MESAKSGPHKVSRPVVLVAVLRRKHAVAGSRRESKAAVFMTKQKEKKTRFPLVLQGPVLMTLRPPTWPCLLKVPHPPHSITLRNSPQHKSF